jgi:hypothetical protein
MHGKVRLSKLYVSKTREENLKERLYLRKRLINSTSREHNLLCKGCGNKPDSGKMNWRYDQGNNTRGGLFFVRLSSDRDREGQGREFIRGVHETSPRK